MFRKFLLNISQKGTKRNYVCNDMQSVMEYSYIFSFYYRVQELGRAVVTVPVIQDMVERCVTLVHMDIIRPIKMRVRFFVKSATKLVMVHVVG